MEKKVDLIGNGNVAQYFWAAFKAAGITVDIWARNPRNLEQKYLPDYQGDSTLTLLCVNDEAIAEVSESLPKTTGVVAHVSGSAPLNVLSSKHAERAIFYPLMSLSPSVKTQLREIPFCLEANTNETLIELEKFTASFSGKAYRVNSKQRPYLHLAAVVAHNFSNHLFHKAYIICQQQQLNFEMLQPLLKQAVGNLGAFDPQLLQTGPAVRKDESTLNKHLKLIENKRLKEIYSLLTKSIQESHETKL
jgi:predicted short-subunit dehydrogenase-like oxidoreductase (DUF2520 family)